MKTLQEIIARIAEIDYSKRLLAEEEFSLTDEANDISLNILIKDKGLSKAVWEVEIRYNQLKLTTKLNQLPELEKLMTDYHFDIDIIPNEVNLRIHDNDVSLLFKSKTNSIEILKQLGIVPSTKNIDIDIKKLETTLENLYYLKSLVKE